MSKLIEQEGKFYKECGVVMLETTQGEKSKLFLETKPNTLFLNQELDISCPAISGRCLYITSDDEIIKGDASNFIFEDKIYFSSTSTIVNHVDFKKARKIIASTDINLPFQPPSPSEKFIQAYI